MLRSFIVCEIQRDPAKIQVQIRRDLDLKGERDREEKAGDVWVERQYSVSS